MTTQSGAGGRQRARAPGPAERPPGRSRSRPRRRRAPPRASSAATSIAPRSRPRRPAARGLRPKPDHLGVLDVLARRQADRAADQPDAEDGDLQAPLRRSLTAAASWSSTSDGGLPGHARVGDRLAVGERPPPSRLWRPSAMNDSSITPDDGVVAARAICAAMSATTSGWRPWSLRLLSCDASITTRSGQPGQQQLAERLRHRRRAVVGRVPAAAQDDVAVAVAARVEDRRGAAHVDAREHVRRGRGAHGVHGHADVAVGAVLEARPASTARTPAGGGSGSRSCGRRSPPRRPCPRCTAA